MIYAISFTDNGKSAAQELADIKDMDITSFAFDELETPLKSWCEDAFKKCEAIVFVGAAGIATRLIAPNIKDKATDPAVIVIDEKKQFVIPILSGHIGGGNELAEKIARHIGAV
ncbi:MAG: cobalamin biosynthesis protein CbiG, partial [Oscillospiraceae bacterium]